MSTTLGLTIRDFVSANIPVIASGFGTSPSLTTANGTMAFKITIGSGNSASTGVVTLPQAANGWICLCTDNASSLTNLTFTKMTANSTTSVTLTNLAFADMNPTAWIAAQVIYCICFPY